MNCDKVKDAIRRSKKALSSAELFLDNGDSANSRRALERSRAWATVGAEMQSSESYDARCAEAAYETLVQEDDAILDGDED